MQTVAKFSPNLCVAAQFIAFRATEVGCGRSHEKKIQTEWSTVSEGTRETGRR
jgi:hypothetical protein